MANLATHDVRLVETDPRARGYERGTQLKQRIATGFDLYLRLFHRYGLTERGVEESARSSLASVASWDAQLLRELEGVAQGSGLDLWQIMALNARTEILSAVPGGRPGECSTVARVSSRVFGAQTWDWHDEMSHLWHAQDVAGTPHAFAGLTESGILSKIGLNDAGISVFLNILGHRGDRVGGVPVHLLTWAVLANAGTLEEAVEIIQGAPVSASSALTVLTPDEGAVLEVSPAGVARIDPSAGWLAHCNHFLSSALAAEEKSELFEPDSQQRLSLVQSRLHRYPAPRDSEDLLAYLYSDVDQPALCCVPAPDAVFGDRWRTLATVTSDNRAGRLAIYSGSPIEARGKEPVVLYPGAGA